MTKKVLPYLQLVRLPNVFTAIADVAMGFFVSHGIVDLASLEPPLVIRLIALAAASACLYMAGMVLNDVFDAEIDRRERPERPIPSGRVPIPRAKLLGFALLTTGMALAVGLSLARGDYRAALVSVAIAVSILTYDTVLKATPLGPVGMGLCRFFNVLLGMSLAPEAWEAWNFIIASGIGVYITGVTWFARTEAAPSNRLSLAMATLVGAAGIVLLIVYPRYAPDSGMIGAINNDPGRWHTLWALLGALVAWRCVWAVADPRPIIVQRAVRQCIFSLVMLDAVVTFAACGLAPAVLVMLLLFPTMFLGQFIYST